MIFFFFDDLIFSGTFCPQILVDEEKFEEADKLFSELACIDSCNPVQYVYQGMLLVQWKGDIAGAVALIKKALEMDKQCEMALENLATISVQTWVPLAPYGGWA